MLYIEYDFYSNSVLHAHLWAVLEPNMLPIIQKIMFPIMQYKEEDEDLYQNDQVEYIQRKFGKWGDLTKTEYKSNENFHFAFVRLTLSHQKRVTFKSMCSRDFNNFINFLLSIDNHDDYSTSVSAAQALFVSCCKIRKGILPQAMKFLISVSISNVFSGTHKSFHRMFQHVFYCFQTNSSKNRVFPNNKCFFSWN